MADGGGNDLPNRADSAVSPEISTKRKTAPSLQLAADADEEHSDKRPKMPVNLDNVKCSICLGIWHDVVSLTPCQHNFCNGCFSEWYKSSMRAGECKCPQCRVAVLYVGRNHAMRSVVEDMLVNDHTLQRPADEIARLEAAALVKSNFMKLSDLNSTSGSTGGARNSGARVGLYIPPGPATGHRQYPSMAAVSTAPRRRYDSDDDEGEDLDDTALEDEEELNEEDEVYDSEEEYDLSTCAQCSDNSSSYKCPTGASHRVCSACARLMPERNDIATTVYQCEICKGVFCDQYWRSQNLPGCPSMKFRPMSERQMSVMPSGAHNANNVEKEYTKEYLDQHSLTVEGVVKDWIAKVDRAEIALSNPTVKSSTSLCDNCANLVAVQLLDKFRMSIPKTELPPAAAQRPDCWYGYACRTQRRAPHAAKLNHMCEPTSDKVQR